MGQGRLLANLIFLSLFTLAGCADKEEPTRWNTFPVVVYMDPALTGNAAAEADFRTAVYFWEAKVGKKLFDYRGAWTGGTPYAGNPAAPSAIFANVLFRLNPWGFAANTAGQTVVNSNEDDKIEASLIMINPATPLCAGDCLGSSSASQRKLFAHELGHFLGLSHSGSINDLMYPELQPGASLTSVTVDMDALHELTKDEESDD